MFTRFAPRLAAYQRPDDRYFRTHNLRLAVVLLARGFPLVNIDQTVPSRCQFVFRTSYGLEDVADRFLERRAVLVDAHRLFLSWQLLRSRMARGHF